jgi:hypothetical protein
LECLFVKIEAIFLFAIVLIPCFPCFLSCLFSLFASRVAPYIYISLWQRFGLSAVQAAQAVELFRLEGVRRANLIKNTNQPFYAFNALQRATLPTSLRPPMVCCGSTLS